MFEKDKSIPPFSSVELYRQASIQRNLVMQACARAAVRASAECFRMLLLRGTRLVHDLAAERQRRSAMRELDRLDDHVLKDMGVRRCEIEFVVRNGMPARRKPYRGLSNGAPAQRRAA
jgi:uncharacterized protein YjiS (DUF1127 family)